MQDWRVNKEAPQTRHTGESVWLMGKLYQLQRDLSHE
jgi:hypothetical protein